jgi:transcription antitermination factor NusG
MNSPWHAVQVLTNHEKRVTQHLSSRSLEHYLPTYSERSRWTDRTVTLERPLFPGYVFIRFDAGERLSVLSTPGVLHLLGRGPAGLIPCVEIERIQTALAKGYRLQPHPAISKGMRVRMKTGIFSGVEGTVTEIRQNCRVVLALSGVDQCFSLEALIHDIEIMNEAAHAPY